MPTFAFADRFPRKHVMLTGGALTLAAMLGVLASGASLPRLLLFAAFFGAGEVATLAAGLAFLSETAEGAARTRTFGVAAAVSGLAGFVANAVGGALAAPIAQVLDAPVDDARTLKALLLLAAAVGASSGIPILLLRGASRPRHVAAPRRWGFLGGLILVWALFGFGAGSFLPFLNLFFAERFRLDFAQVGVILGLISVGGAVGALLHTRVAPRVGDLRAIVAVWATSLPFAVVAGFAPVAYVAAAVLVVRGVLMTSVQPTWDAFFLSRLHPHERSGAQAVAATLWSLAYGLGAFISGSVRAALGDPGFTVNLLTLVAAYVAAMAAFVAVFRATEAVESASL